MWTIIIILLVAWLVLAILGAVIEGLFWLLIIAVVLFLATVAYGWLRNKARSR